MYSDGETYYRLIQDTKFDHKIFSKRTLAIWKLMVLESQKAA